MSTSSKPLGAKRPAKHWAVSTLQYYQPRGVRSQGRRPGRLERCGTMSAAAALSLAAMLTFVALSSDLGLLYAVRAAWPSSANAAALTAAAQWLDCSGPSSDEEQALGHDAGDFAEPAHLGRNAPAIDLNCVQRYGDMPVQH